MKWKYAAVLASFLMVTMAFAVVASAEDDTPTTPKTTALENFELAQEHLSARAEYGVSPTNAPDEMFTYTDGPYPIYNNDGSPPGVNTVPPWGNHYVSDVMYNPPNNAGGWYSMDATGGAGLFAVGDTHESYIGDQNGNGVIEWITGFGYAPWGNDGLDNDGDGCIDEKTYGASTGQIGCNMVPDQIVYYETGGLPDAGGDNGDLMTNVDWYSAIQAIEVYRAFVSPKWMAYQSRGFMEYPQIAGEFISYYAYEGNNGVNSNPEVDSDMSDMYAGNVDARGFPARPPVDRACSAGYQLYMGITFMREDGWVVTSHEQDEYFDNVDWNGDGDQNDEFAAYYAIDPATGNCRDNAVLVGVYGWYPRNTGTLLTPGYTFEYGDNNDWNGDGDISDTVLIYHDIETTWAMKGKVYTSFTFTASIPAFGFGWSAIYSTYAQFQTFPLRFGSSWYEYVGSAGGYYHTYVALTGEEDGNRQTLLPGHDIGIGMPSASPGGYCVQIYTAEIYAYYAGIRLYGGIADANGDGDQSDYYYNTYFCPEETGGGGSWIVEDTSKFAKGMYRDPIPAIHMGYVYYSADGTAGGLCILPSFWYDSYLNGDDVDGDLIGYQYHYYHQHYWIQFTKPDFEFVPGTIGWVFTGDVQPGGTVIGTFDLINTGGINIKITEDKGIETDKGFKLQGLSARDRIGPDGTIEPQETATFYFAVTVSAGSPIGPMDVKIIVTYGGVTKEDTITLPIILKMFGNDLSCYRHRQNTLRKLRSFDMDDDEGMLHNLEPGDLVNVDGQLLAPENAILLMISWYENGCQGTGHRDVEHAKSAASGLTGHYGMGQAYWGFIPGLEEGNEGNGNGGLNGKDRKAVYGF